MIKLIFWLSLIVSLYIYIGYPALLSFVRLFYRRKRHPDHACFPLVTLIVSAYNEEKVIGEKIRNALSLDYPSDRLEIMVVSDASSDKTDDIVRQFKDRGVKLIRMPERRGKTFGLNKAVQEARGEILVFSDANAIYDKNALKELVKFFADATVGYVVGKAEYYENLDKLAGKQENIYWKYELKIKELESDINSVVGGDGAIYAVRKDLYEPLAADDINDFVNPLQVICKGYQGVFNPNAVCREDAAGDFEKEFYRKKRIVNRSWRAVLKMRCILNPFKSGLFWWELFSHKILRWYWWLFAILLLISNILLYPAGAFYRVFLLAQLGFYLLVVVGWLGMKFRINLPSILMVPFYFIEVHIASMIGIFESFFGKKYQTWNTARDGNPS